MDTPAEQLMQLVTHMAQALVNSPESVRVKAVVGSSSVILELYVRDEEIGQLIGKDGVNADALHTLLRAAAGKSGIRAVLDIIQSLHSGRHRATSIPHRYTR